MSFQKLRIGILGTRGIPNRYGGFEQCAEFLALGLVSKGHDVSVYNSSDHEFQQNSWQGINIIHCYDPEKKWGTAGQFIYDLNCLKDARSRRFDILLQLGYTSNSVWHWLWPRRSINIVNMDGLEWMRTKYSPLVQRFLKHAERWAAMNADVLVADSLGIQEHLKNTYNKPSVFIPYGAPVFESPDETVLQQFNVLPQSFFLLIARMEPENNVEIILEGVTKSNSALPLIVVGNTGNDFGKTLAARFGKHPNVRFTGAIYDATIINNLRHFSALYFHGHSVGGTNPSLLEAMGCQALIAAHDNVFNRTVLGDDAFYFQSAGDIPAIISKNATTDFGNFKTANEQKIRSQYSWERIVNSYEELMLNSVKTT